MSQVVALAGEKRINSGTGAARALRREGKIPAIIYGGKKEELPITVGLKELAREYGRGNFTSKIVDLEIGKEKVRVLPREVQLHPVTDVPMHADFLRLEKGDTVSVKVRVRFINEDQCTGIKRGGVLNIVRRYVDYICDADHIPEYITVDLAGRHIAESIHISQIVEKPKNAAPAIQDRDFTIATIAGRGGKDDEGEDGEAATEGAEAKEDAAE